MSAYAAANISSSSRSLQSTFSTPGCLSPSARFPAQQLEKEPAPNRRFHDHRAGNTANNDEISGNGTLFHSSDTAKNEGGTIPPGRPGNATGVAQKTSGVVEIKDTPVPGPETGAGR
ncbi:hypothetical protein Nans01_00910 [Nocardiopsis ansamitocini]|uniref:Uncharacterized protein n=1 Tax=Nocardiopsis ansamitocini TaxID=1670832 RepID=A0A9W6UH95_9ACTN|nr:hypothetical protein Nans01_00910 [Nocardiopsis ansamitocini]